MEDFNWVDLVVKIAVPVLMAIITTFVIPAVVKWISNLKNTKLETFIKNAVNAAEQMYGPGTGEEKKQYVIDLVKKAFKNIGVSDEVLDAMIESAVYSVSGAIKQAKEQLASSTDTIQSATVVDSNLTIIEDNSKKVEETNESTGIKLS